MLSNNSPCILVLDYSSKIEDLAQSLKIACSQFDLVLFVTHANAHLAFSEIDSFVRRNDPKNFHVFDITKIFGVNEENRAKQISQSHSLVKNFLSKGIVTYLSASSQVDQNLRIVIKNEINEWMKSGRPFGTLTNLPGSFTVLLESRVNLISDKNGSLSISFQ